MPEFDSNLVPERGPTIRDTWRGTHPSADVLCAACGERFDKHRQHPYCNCPKTKSPLRDGEWPYRVEAFVPAFARDVTDEVAALRAELEQARAGRHTQLGYATAYRGRAERAEAEVERLTTEVVEAGYKLTGAKFDLEQRSDVIARYHSEGQRLKAEVERLTRERDAWKREWRIVADEVERMRPVVDAACHVRDADFPRRSRCEVYLARAVDAYRVATSEQEASEHRCPQCQSKVSDDSATCGCKILMCGSEATCVEHGTGTATMFIDRCSAAQQEANDA